MLYADRIGRGEAHAVSPLDAAYRYVDLAEARRGMIALASRRVEAGPKQLYQVAVLFSLDGQKWRTLCAFTSKDLSVLDIAELDGDLYISWQRYRDYRPVGTTLLRIPKQFVAWP